MTKYKEFVQRMLDENKNLFDSFQALHDRYALDQDSFQEEFNKEGERVMAIVRHYEDKLCNRSEGSGFASFTGNLAEKFHEELKKHFPLIDNIGIKTNTSYSNFFLKKINLS